MINTGSESIQDFMEGDVVSQTTGSGLEFPKTVSFAVVSAPDGVHIAVVMDSPNDVDDGSLGLTVIGDNIGGLTFAEVDEADDTTATYPELFFRWWS